MESLSGVAAWKVCWKRQHEKSVIGMTAYEKIGASNQERLRWPDLVPVEVTSNYKMMALQTIEAASWPDQVPVEVQGQVVLC